MAVNDKLGDAIIVTIIATGFDTPEVVEEDNAVSNHVSFEATSEHVDEKEDEDDSNIPTFFRQID